MSANGAEGFTIDHRYKHEQYYYFFHRSVAYSV